jgi:membrane-associated protease RseP (regulator of RpoE activity)
VNQTLLFILGVVLLMVGVGASIAIHEFGHMYPAKKFGVLVTKYMIGFGPTIKSWRRGETEYGFKLIPLGGYIAMVGMPSRVRAPKFWREMVEGARQANAEQAGSVPRHRWFTSLPIHKRLIVMFGGPFMNLVFGTVLMFIALAAIGAPGMGTSITKVYSCVPSDLVKFECAAGDRVGPAQVAGLQDGDKVLSFNGVSASRWSDITTELGKRVGQPTPITVLRDNKTLELTISPVTIESPLYDQSGKVATGADGKPLTELRPFIGVKLRPEMFTLSAGQVLTEIGTQLSGTVGLIAALPAEVAQMAGATFGGGDRNANGPVSLIGVGQIAGEVASSPQLDLTQKLGAGLSLLASLNFALFVFNLIPLLPLDGGHMAAGIFESVKKLVFKIRRKAWKGPVDLTKIVPLTYGMWILLMGMSLLFIVADIVKPLA